MEAINSINSQITEKVDIEWLPLDLTSLPSIKTAAEKVISKTDRLDILILNAGIMAVPYGKTEAGFEIQLGTNHVGHFLLTKLLMPTLQKTATAGSDVRVVTVSSEAHNLAPGLETIVNTEKLCNTSPWTRYGASKAGNIMFASGLAKKYPNLTSTSIHPGVIMTDLHGPSRQSNSLISVGTRLVAPFIAQDVPHGALNQLWAATTKKEDIENGGYYTPVGKLQSTLKLSKDENTIQRFWDWTESELAKVGY
jgi:NAD(P)-dependent dehydrogenase (short-subunit alcohol dehydrogenase family)